VKNKKNKIKWD